MDLPALDLLGQGPLLLALRALIEIPLLTYLGYRVILVIRGTRAAPVALGVVLLGLLYLVSGLLGLETTRRVLGSVAPYGILVIIVVFQPEIRTALRQLALHFFSSRRMRGVRNDEYEDIIVAVGQLSLTRTGALIVLERDTGLRTFIQSGVALDAKLSSDLLISIFQRRSPLHDGAVIVQRRRIAAAVCYLPLTTNPGLIISLGSRHRAAIGITEESDCVAIVVSETGRVSTATGGNIELDASLDRLRELVFDHFGPVVSPPSKEEQSPPAHMEAPPPAHMEAPPPAHMETPPPAQEEEPRLSQERLSEEKDPPQSDEQSEAATAPLAEAVHAPNGPEAR